MALNKRGPTYLRLYARALGIAGVMALFYGGVVVSAVALALGVALVGLAIYFEIKLAHSSLLSGRGRVGSGVFLQVLLAAVLLAGVNVFSFFHHTRLDLTRDGEFSELRRNADFRADLKRLTADTRIVVYRRGQPFGQFADKQDNYAAAATRKIIAKVRDNVEQFQELGPRFRVEVLDIQEDDYQDKLKALKAAAPKLAEAIEQAPEDSIFFYADGKVQRLAFHDVYQLDRKASQAANDGRGNLVLRYQGIEPFARKVLNVDERKPRVAIGVVHEVLSTENADEVNKQLGMAGVKKALASRGYETRDIILKKWGDGPPEPAVLTFDENRFERLEGEIAELEDTIKSRTETIQELQEVKKFWTGGSPQEADDRVNKRFIIVLEDGDELLATQAQVAAAEKKTGKKFTTQRISAKTREDYVKRNIQPSLELHQLNLQQEQSERDALVKEQQGLNVEDLSEQRRITDVRAKLARTLADCDLLILPRMTLLDVARGEAIPNRVYKLDSGQVMAIRDFLAAGKPVLFCLGPTNEAPGRFDPEAGGTDPVEGMLAELGFRLPKQTILYNVETKSFGERRGMLLIMGPGRVEVPPLEFAWKAGGRSGVFKDSGKGNPIRTSLEVAGRGAGKDPGLGLRLRHPRPVYLVDANEKAKDDAVFLMTGPDAWNEAQPFPTREKSPRYEPAKKGDPAEGTVAEKRQGQFPVGVAAELPVPASWGEGKATAAKVRVAVIGHGGVFMGPTLNPTQEKLLLDTANWLLGRDDLLARPERTWEYPRVREDPQDIWMWQAFGGAGPPVFFVLLGGVVLMLRRIR